VQATIHPDKLDKHNFDYSAKTIGTPHLCGRKEELPGGVVLSTYEELPHECCVPIAYVNAYLELN
jgi:hypothetical protein